MEFHERIQPLIDNWACGTWFAKLSCSQSGYACPHRPINRKKF
jgi:hypothetical protein